MIATYVAVAAAASAGLVSSVHCAAMCGPLAAFAGQDARAMASYHGARLLAYGGLGAVAGATGSWFGGALPSVWAGAIVSWGLAVALGVTGWRLWRGGAGSRPALVQLGRRPRASSRARVVARLPRHPAVVGALTSLLPCGALYAAVLLAAGSYSVVGGALAMLTFGLTSAIGLGLAGALLLRARARLAHGRPTWVRRVAATVMLVGAVMLVVRPLESLRVGDASASQCHSP